MKQDEKRLHMLYSNFTAPDLSTGISKFYIGTSSFSTGFSGQSKPFPYINISSTYDNSYDSFRIDDTSISFYLISHHAKEMSLGSPSRWQSIIHTKRKNDSKIQRYRTIQSKPLCSSVHPSCFFTPITYLQYKNIYHHKNT